MTDPIKGATTNPPRPATKADAPPPPPPSATESESQLLSCPKTLLMGPPGSGKTDSLTTYIEAGLDLFVIITDPGGDESLIDAVKRRKLDINKLHYYYLSPASPSWDTLGKMAKKIGLMGYDDLSKLKTGIEKSDYQQYFKLIALCGNFIDQRTGKEFGPIDSWGEDRAFALDSLSGVNTMAMDMVLGAKPTAHQGEWGVAMSAEEKLIKKLCSDLKCFFTLTAHIEREPNEITGVPTISVGALGRKLAPKLPKDFSDAVLQVKTEAGFFWSTQENNTDLKARTLPLSSKLQPSFCQVVDSWRKRKELATSTSN